MHTCVRTVTYLRGGLSACSVVRLLVSYFFLTFIIFFDATVQNLCLKAFEQTARNFFSQRRLNCGTSLLECGSVVLVCNYKFSTKDDNF